MIQTLDSGNSIPSNYVNKNAVQMQNNNYNQSSMMSSLENKSNSGYVNINFGANQSSINNSRAMPPIGHVNNTAFFPKTNSLNQSGLNGPYDNQYHRQSLRPDTRLGGNSNENSKWLSSIEHVVSGEGYQN
jgi:hypothetical protein